MRWWTKQTESHQRGCGSELSPCLMIIVAYLPQFYLCAQIFPDTDIHLLGTNSGFSNAGVLLFFILSEFGGKNVSIKTTYEKHLSSLVYLSILFFRWSIHQLATPSSAHLRTTLFKQTYSSKFSNFPTHHCGSGLLMSLYLLNPIWELVFSSNSTKQVARYLLFSVFVHILSTLAEYITGNSLVASPIFNNFTAWTGYACYYLYIWAAKRSWYPLRIKG